MQIGLTSNRQLLFFNYAMQLCFRPYKWGGNFPYTGLDCSGLAIELMMSQGLVQRGFDSTAQNLFKMYPEIKEKELQLGDFIYYGSSKTSITHIAIYLMDGLMIEAGGGNSRTNSIDSAERVAAFVRIRPYKVRQDVVAFNRPKWGW